MYFNLVLTEFHLTFHHGSHTLVWLKVSLCYMYHIKITRSAQKFGEKKYTMVPIDSTLIYYVELLCYIDIILKLNL